MFPLFAFIYADVCSIVDSMNKFSNLAMNYIWASQHSTDYFASVRHRGQLCTRRPALAHLLRSSHRPMMALQSSRALRHLSWKLMGNWPGMPHRLCHPPRLQVLHHPVGSARISWQCSQFRLLATGRITLVERTSLATCSTLHQLRPESPAAGASQL
jgi:hypothetical protein